MSAVDTLSESKQIAILLYQKEVDSAFDLKSPHTVKRVDILSKKFHVHSFNIDTLDEAYACVQKVVGLSKKCDYLEFAAHGDQQEIVFNNKAENGFFSLKSHDRIVKLVREILQMVDKNGIIIAQSCANGAKALAGGNILQRIAELAVPGQRIIGTSSKSIHFEIYPDHLRHFRFVETETGKNVTCIYVKDEDGAVQEISCQQIEVLWSVLGSSKNDLELSYRILTAMNAPDKLSYWLKNRPDLPGRVIQYLKNLTLKKDDTTVWGEMLTDLESLSEALHWDMDKEVMFKPTDRGFHVIEHDETIIGPDHDKKHRYRSVYQFILSLAAMEEHSSLLVMLDNGAKYMYNSGAQALFALTDHVLHAHQVSIKHLLWGDVSVLSITKYSYRLAKEQGKLLEWFQIAFQGSCLDERCEAIQNYLNTSLVGYHFDPIISQIFFLEGDDPRKIVQTCAGLYEKSILDELGIQSGSDISKEEQYLQYQLRMTEKHFEDYIEEVMQRHRGSDWKISASIKEAMNELGIFSSLDDVVAIMRKAAKDQPGDLAKLKEFIPFDYGAIAEMIAQNSPHHVSRLLNMLGYSLNDALNFCIEHEISTVSLGKYRFNVTDEYLKDSLVKHDSIICLDLSWCCQITDEGLQVIAKKYPLLQKLSLCGCIKISENGVNTIADSCKELKEINLQDTYVYSTGLKYLAENCTKLAKIQFKGVEVTDSVVKKYIVNCPGLMWVNLSSCYAISDSSVRMLADRCEQLKFVNLKGATKVSNDAISYLKERHPHADVQK